MPFTNFAAIEIAPGESVRIQILYGPPCYLTINTCNPGSKSIKIRSKLSPRCPQSPSCNVAMTGSNPTRNLTQGNANPTRCTLQRDRKKKQRKQNEAKTARLHHDCCCDPVIQKDASKENARHPLCDLGRSIKEVESHTLK